MPGSLHPSLAGSSRRRFPAEQRPFTCFRAPIRELIKARIWAGVHFRTADVQGAVLGRKSSAICKTTTSSQSADKLAAPLSGSPLGTGRPDHALGGARRHPLTVPVCPLFSAPCEHRILRVAVVRTTGIDVALR